MLSNLLKAVRNLQIMEGRDDMSAVGVQMGVSDAVNPIDLSAKMGISLEALSKAAHADCAELSANPRQERWQPGLRAVAGLWQDITATFGGEDNARRFLNLARPELMDQTPLHYLDQGEPEIVRNLVQAMRETLP